VPRTIFSFQSNEGGRAVTSTDRVNLIWISMKELVFTLVVSFGFWSFSVCRFCSLLARNCGFPLLASSSGLLLKHLVRPSLSTVAGLFSPAVSFFDFVSSSSDSTSFYS
jgi:hypothetical protein